MVQTIRVAACSSSHRDKAITTSSLQRWILLLFVSGCVQAQKCFEGIKHGPQLPTLPDQFSVGIEVNLLHLDLTVHVTQYYDSISNRGRVEVHSRSGSMIILLNFNALEVSYITTIGRNKKCFASSLNSHPSQSTDSAHDYKLPFDTLPLAAELTAQITAATEFMKFGKEFNETYIGIETVRGIPCHRWHSCNVSEDFHTLYTIDQYFTMSNWSGNPSMMPTQIVINGTWPDSNAPNSTIHKVYNVYSFFNFRPGPADDDLFRVPPGQPCLGRMTGKPLPSLPEDYFTALYETTFSGTITYTRVSSYLCYSIWL